MNDETRSHFAKAVDKIDAAYHAHVAKHRPVRQSAPDYAAYEMRKNTWAMNGNYILDSLDQRAKARNHPMLALQSILPCNGATERGSGCARRHLQRWSNVQRIDCSGISMRSEVVGSQVCNSPMNHPEATPAEYQDAVRRIFQECGV